MYKRSKLLPSVSVLPLKMTATQYTFSIILPLIVISWTSSVLSQSCPSETVRDQIDFVWNVPTNQCFKFGPIIRPRDYGIRVNPGQTVVGKTIAIFYTLGQFPVIDSNGTWQFGGVPQNGNLTEHLLAVEQEIITSLPNPDFEGLGVIDFESWRPVWSMATGTQAIYRDASIELAQTAFPNYNQSAVMLEAANEFEHAGRMYMIETLNVCKRLRPKGKWGYYGYPLVDNYNYGEYNVSSTFMAANDELADLFGNSTGLFPSIYIFKENLTSEERALQVQGRLTETVRVRTNPNTPIYPYFMTVYHEVNEFLTKDDLEDIIGMVYNSQAYGMVIWGGSSQVNSSQDCDTFKTYVDTLLGPIIESYINCTTAVPSSTDPIHTLSNQLLTGQFNIF